MKQWQFYTLLGVSALCVVLSIGTVISGKSNQKLQTELQQQQADINRGSLSQQVGQSLLRDMAVSASKDDKMKDVLAKNGYTLTQNSPAPSATPAPAGSPKP